MSRTLQIRLSKLLQLRSPPFLFTLCDHLKWLPSVIASKLFHFIEQWSDYYEDDGEEAALMHDTYKYYFPELCMERGEKLSEFIFASGLSDGWRSVFLSKLSRGYDASLLGPKPLWLFLCSAIPLLSRLLP